jgi:exopolysaccharide biosynthesis protein
MKHIIRIAAILLALICLLVLIPTSVASAEIIEYTLKDKKGVPLQQDGYDLDNMTYEDPSITVRITTGRYMDTNYMVAYVKVANATQIRSTMSGSYYTDDTIGGIAMAKSTNAALAINGDFFSSRRNVGYTARMGREFKNKCNATYDVMVLDNMGDMHIIVAPTKQDMIDFKAQLEADGRTIVNGYTFGPGLVINGEKQTGFVDMDNAADRAAQRMCLAQIGPLEYLCISSEGPEDPGSTGLTMEQFSQLVASFEGVINAYNLDGGSSSTMVFNKDKVNSPNNPKRRPLKDIIYFASAWKPE